jgi:hypothetical protein
MASPSPKEIAAALDGQSKKTKALKAKNQALEDEVLQAELSVSVRSAVAPK